MLLIDELVFPVSPRRTVVVRGEQKTLKPYQVVVWISVRPPAQFLPPAERDHLPRSAKTVAAVLDTGHNATRALRDDDLVAAGLPEEEWRYNPSRARAMRDASGEYNLVPTVLADVWIVSEPSADRAFTTVRLPLGNLGVNVYRKVPPAIGAHISADLWRKWLAEHGVSGQATPRTVAGPALPLLGLGALCQGVLEIELQCCPHEVRLKVQAPGR